MWQKSSARPELPEDEAGRARMAARAHERGLILLTYREHSCRQLFEKLCRSFPPESAAQAVARLQESGLLSDERFAEQYAREAATRKFYAPARIAYELRERGVERETADAALEALEYELEPGALINEFLTRRFDGWPQEPAQQRRAYSALQRLGWSNAQIRAAVRTED